MIARKDIRRGTQARRYRGRFRSDRITALYKLWVPHLGSVSEAPHAPREPQGGAPGRGRPTCRPQAVPQKGQETDGAERGADWKARGIEQALAEPALYGNASQDRM